MVTRGPGALEALFPSAARADGETLISERGLLAAYDARVFWSVVQFRPCRLQPDCVGLWTLHGALHSTVNEGFVYNNYVPVAYYFISK